MLKGRIYIIALAALGGGLSGGDRIFIEFARRWSKNIRVNLYVWEQGLAMCRREKLEGKSLKINLVKIGLFSKLGFVFTYFYRILLGLKLGLTLQLKEGDLVYSASEFWMDSLPALILKLRNPKIKWAAAWYQTAPNPFQGFSEGKRQNTYKLSAFLYWFMQLPVKPLVSRLADCILVNNPNEGRAFGRFEDKTIVVLGAVDTKSIKKYQKLYLIKEYKYLAVFQGRFHPQKGVVELIDIWKKVTEKIPEAKLAMIGDGPLMDDVKEKIKQLKLENKVKLFGYLHDGDEKYSIFNSSKIVVHPAFFDSGGMAAAEAIAFGLPCVVFDLKSYAYYYPKGVMKVKVGDNQAFAEAVVELDENNSLYRRIATEGLDMIKDSWSWDTRAFDILNKITDN